MEIPIRLLLRGEAVQKVISTMMIPSSHDMLALIAEMNGRRIAMVAGERMKCGILITADQKRKLATVRSLHHRYVRGDYRHDAKEAGIAIEVARMLIDWHNQNKGVSERKVEIGTTGLDAKHPCQPGTYQEFLAKVHNEW